MKLWLRRFLLLLLVSAMAISPRLHALAGTDSHTGSHQHARAHHHTTHSGSAEHPPIKGASGLSHAQCLIACLVIPAPELASAQPPECPGTRLQPALFTAREGSPPAPLDRPPRACS